MSICATADHVTATDAVRDWSVRNGLSYARRLWRIGPVVVAVMLDREDGRARLVPHSDDLIAERLTVRWITEPMPR